MTENIHTAMLAIMNEVGYVQKEKSKDVKYSLKTENSVIQAIRPAMLKHGVYMYPAGVKDAAHSQFEAGQYKNIWNRIVATHVYRFVHAESATSIDVEVLGDGADTGDKAGNKSMTTSKKYALLEAFLLETGDDPDTTPSSEMTQTVQKAKVTAPPVPETNKHKPEGPVGILLDLGVDNTPHAANLATKLKLTSKMSKKEISALYSNYADLKANGKTSDEAAAAVTGEK